jgi:hypothetical protein
MLGYHYLMIHDVAHVLPMLCFGVCLIQRFYVDLLVLSSVVTFHRFIILLYLLFVVKFSDKIDVLQ